MHAPPPVGDTTPFNLEAIVAELRGEATYSNVGHAARTLLRASDLRLVLVAMKSGSRMNEHKTQETVLLHTLSGSVRLDLPDQSHALGPGNITAIERGVRHAVEADRDSAFLLTLGWPAQIDE